MQKCQLPLNNAYTSLHTRKTKKSQSNSVKSKQGQTPQMLDLQKALHNWEGIMETFF